MLLFDRKIKVVILTCAESYTITDLHMSFECEFSKDPKKLNSGKVVIYNLSDETRKNIYDNYLSIEVYAGYGEELTLIFTGRIIDLQNRKERTDWVTEIQALDGGDNVFNRFYNKSWSANTKVQMILNDVVNAMGLPFQYGQSIIMSSLYTGATYSGKCKDVLNEVCKSYNMDWSIQRGVVVVTDRSFPPLSALSQIVILSSDTGLIGSPNISKEDDIEVTKKDKKKGVLVKPVGRLTFTSLLNPLILPNVVVMFMPTFPTNIIGVRMQENKKGNQVTGTHYALSTKGLYTVSKCKYSGSNFENNFYVDGECEIYAN